jgi:hypothetical protein
MREATPQLRNLAEEMISNGALALRVSKTLLDTDYLLVTAHGDHTRLGPETPCYTEYRGIKAVKVGGKRFQFDYEFDPSGPTAFGSLPLYVTKELASPQSGGFEATTLKNGLKTVFGTAAGDTE